MIKLSVMSVSSYYRNRIGVPKLVTKSHKGLNMHDTTFGKGPAVLPKRERIKERERERERERDVQGWSRVRLRGCCSSEVPEGLEVRSLRVYIASSVVTICWLVMMLRYDLVAMRTAYIVQCRPLPPSFFAVVISSQRFPSNARRGSFIVGSIPRAESINQKCQTAPFLNARTLPLQCTFHYLCILLACPFLHLGVLSLLFTFLHPLPVLTPARQ